MDWRTKGWHMRSILVQQHDKAHDTLAHSVMKKAFIVTLIQYNLQDDLFDMEDYAKEEDESQ